MVDIGISLTGKLIEVVGSEAIRQIHSLRGYESELDDLKETVITIRKLLLDAESKGQPSDKAQYYIQKLQDALYEADDVFDEVRTRAELKQRNKNAKLSEKVCNFFSYTINTPSVVISMSREFKKIMKKLDGITSNHITFGCSNHNTFRFSVNSQPIRERREDTRSYVYSDEVIVGREGDLNKVVHMLLDSSSQDKVSFVSIVGVGGTGKTTLARLVFNDDRVATEFPVRLWTCVSDEYAEEFKMKRILAKILESAFSDNKLDGLTLDLVHRKLLGFLGGKKYLIVLDDVWNEDFEKWLSLKKFLMSGGGGSKVLVTTRSERTAMVVDEEHKYELKGLSPENSWRLFEMTAFREKELNYAELVTLGKKIVEQCSNVPLAIKVVGTLLYGQNEKKWRLFTECGLAKLKDGDNKIMSILELSYDNLDSLLKTCFTYCALFPKDFRINKEKLIRLWMAQGYIIPLDVGQSLEDAGEEYISILLRRCFFQDVEKNNIGGVESFKIHDLFHDVAQEVAGKAAGVVAVSSIQTNFGDEAHHLFHRGSKCKGNIFSKCRIRSYVRDGYEINFPVAELLENWKFLRTLDLHDLDIKTLPNSIGKLLHLRYLDLSDNKRLLALPDSVTKLYNLQTFYLKRCEGLKELPKGLAKLANLRHLDISGCYVLRHMPSGLDKLSCLCVRARFVINEESSIGDLENLLALKNLRGSFEIRITHKFVGTVECRGGYLRSMNHLEELEIWMEGDGNHETLLAKLEPPSYLKQLNLYVYNGSKLPSTWWGSGKLNNWVNFLPNLVQFKLYNCHDLLCLPSLSKLPHLKSLTLYSLKKLEYIEDSNHNGSREVFFPSLEELRISFMSELRGWWRGEDMDSNNHVHPCFSRLSKLYISMCGKLTSFPACISLEDLRLLDANKELWITTLGQENNSIKLRELHGDNVDYLKLLTMEGLTNIHILANDVIESMSQLTETFKSCPSLRNLEISFCRNLRSFDGVGWEHLTALDSLELTSLPNFTFLVSTKEEDGDDDGMPWRFIGRRLRSLELSYFDMKTISKGIRHLTFLENLTIHRLRHLTSLPECISCLSSLRSLSITCCLKLQLNVGILRDLTSLQLLEVRECPLVTERFRNPDEEDWANLRHIPCVDIRPGDIHL